MRTALAAIIVAALVAPALADDCLTGPTTLNDQRALAALRTETETSCHCEAAATRKEYQRCAKGVLDASLISGTVRQECAKTAKATYRDTTCGTTKETCGVVDTTDLSASCKVTKVGRCKDSRRRDGTACPAETHCADVVQWSAGTCVDVRDQGPFAPGFHAMQFTKNSVVSPTMQRVLDTAIWYPAPPGSGPIGASGGVTDAPVDLSGGPYPLVMFSHGSCGYEQQSIFLMGLLASHGFVVVAPRHPGNTIFEFPNCSTLAAQAASLQERPQDIIFVIDQMLAANQDPQSAFFGMIDPDRIAMTGHSFGGLTTYLVTAIEPRIKVAIPMAPAALGNPHLMVPSLTMVGGIDGVVNNTLTRTAYAASVSPRYLVEIDHAGHFAFSNGCFPGPDCSPPTTLTQDEAHALVLRYVIPFLERHLAGDQTFAPFLDGPPAIGVTFDSQL